MLATTFRVMEDRGEKVTLDMKPAGLSKSRKQLLKHFSDFGMFESQYLEFTNSEISWTIHCTIRKSFVDTTENGFEGKDP